MVTEDFQGSQPVCPVCGSDNVITDPPYGPPDADMICANCGARTFADDPEWFPLTNDEDDEWT